MSHRACKNATTGERRLRDKVFGEVVLVVLPANDLISFRAASHGDFVAGTMITDAVTKAYVFSKGGSRGRWLSEGDIIMGRKLEAIDTMSVRLRQAGRSFELQLYTKR